MAKSQTIAVTAVGAAMLAGASVAQRRRACPVCAGTTLPASPCPT